jgi:hypothetical protein
LAVPVISWLKQSVLFLVLIGVFLAGVAMTLWPRRLGQTAASEIGTRPQA